MENRTNDGKRRIDDNIRDALEFTSESALARNVSMSPQQFRYKRINGFWPWEADAVISSIADINQRVEYE